jgi:anti-sigma factor RsiW
MRCARVQERLLLYLAQELEPREAAQLSSHLESCERCSTAAAEMAETLEQLDDTLRTTVRAPLSLNAHVMAAVRRRPARRRWPVIPPAWRWRRSLIPASVALCLLISGYLIGNWHATRNRLPRHGVSATHRPTLPLALLGEDHLEYLANPQPAQVPGPDPRDVSRRMTQLLRYPVAVVDLQPDGARLLGGRKCQLRGVPTAFLLYDWKGERVSLYQIDERKLGLPSLREVLFHGRRFQVGEVDGLTYVTWRSGAMEFVMVSGTKSARLLHLACRASGMRGNGSSASPENGRGLTPNSAMRDSG